MISSLLSGVVEAVGNAMGMSTLKGTLDSLSKAEKNLLYAAAQYEHKQLEHAAAISATRKGERELLESIYYSGLAPSILDLAYSVSRLKVMRTLLIASEDVASIAALMKRVRQLREEQLEVRAAMRSKPEGNTPAFSQRMKGIVSRARMLKAESSAEDVINSDPSVLKIRKKLHDLSVVLSNREALLSGRRTVLQRLSPGSILSGSGLSFRRKILLECVDSEINSITQSHADDLACEKVLMSLIQDAMPLLWAISGPGALPPAHGVLERTFSHTKVRWMLLRLHAGEVLKTFHWKDREKEQEAKEKGKEREKDMFLGHTSSISKSLSLTMSKNRNKSTLMRSASNPLSTWRERTGGCCPNCVCICADRPSPSDNGILMASDQYSTADSHLESRSLLSARVEPCDDQHEKSVLLEPATPTRKNPSGAIHMPTAPISNTSASQKGYLNRTVTKKHVFTSSMSTAPAKRDLPAAILAFLLTGCFDGILPVVTSSTLAKNVLIGPDLKSNANFPPQPPLLTLPNTKTRNINLRIKTETTTECSCICCNVNAGNGGPSGRLPQELLEAGESLSVLLSFASLSQKERIHRDALFSAVCADSRWPEGALLQKWCDVILASSCPPTLTFVHDLSRFLTSYDYSSQWEKDLLQSHNIPIPLFTPGELSRGVPVLIPGEDMANVSSEDCAPNPPIMLRLRNTTIFEKVAAADDRDIELQNVVLNKDALTVLLAKGGFVSFFSRDDIDDVLFHFDQIPVTFNDDDVLDVTLSPEAFADNLEHKIVGVLTTPLVILQYILVDRRAKLAGTSLFGMSSPQVRRSLQFDLTLQPGAILHRFPSGRVGLRGKLNLHSLYQKILVAVRCSSLPAACLKEFCFRTGLYMTPENLSLWTNVNEEGFYIAAAQTNTPFLQANRVNEERSEGSEYSSEHSPLTPRANLAVIQRMTLEGFLESRVIAQDTGLNEAAKEAISKRDVLHSTGSGGNKSLIVKTTGAVAQSLNDAHDASLPLAITDLFVPSSPDNALLEVDTTNKSSTSDGNDEDSSNIPLNSKNIIELNARRATTEVNFDILNMGVCTSHFKDDASIGTIDSIDTASTKPDATSASNGIPDYIEVDPIFRPQFVTFSSLLLMRRKFVDQLMDLLSGRHTRASSYVPGDTDYHDPELFDGDGASSDEDCENDENCEDNVEVNDTVPKSSSNPRSSKSYKMRLNRQRLSAIRRLVDRLMWVRIASAALHGVDTIKRKDIALDSLAPVTSSSQIAGPGNSTNNNGRNLASASSQGSSTRGSLVNQIDISDKKMDIVKNAGEDRNHQSPSIFRRTSIIQRASEANVTSGDMNDLSRNTTSSCAVLAPLPSPLGSNSNVIGEFSPSSRLSAQADVPLRTPAKTGPLQADHSSSGSYATTDQLDRTVQTSPSYYQTAFPNFTLEEEEPLEGRYIPPECLETFNSDYRWRNQSHLAMRLTPKNCAIKERYTSPLPGEAKGCIHQAWDGYPIAPCNACVSHSLSFGRGGLFSVASHLLSSAELAPTLGDAILCISAAITCALLEASERSDAHSLSQMLQSGGKVTPKATGPPGADEITSFMFFLCAHSPWRWPHGILSLIENLAMGKQSDSSRTMLNEQLSDIPLEKAYIASIDPVTRAHIRKLVAPDDYWSDGDVAARLEGWLLHTLKPAVKGLATAGAKVWLSSGKTEDLATSLSTPNASTNRISNSSPVPIETSGSDPSPLPFPPLSPIDALPISTNTASTTAINANILSNGSPISHALHDSPTTTIIESNKVALRSVPDELHSPDGKDARALCSFTSLGTASDALNTKLSLTSLPHIEFEVSTQSIERNEPVLALKATHSVARSRASTYSLSDLHDPTKKFGNTINSNMTIDQALDMGIYAESEDRTGFYDFDENLEKANQPAKLTRQELEDREKRSMVAKHQVFEQEVPRPIARARSPIKSNIHAIASELSSAWSAVVSGIRGRPETVTADSTSLPSDNSDPIFHSVSAAGMDIGLERVFSLQSVAEAGNDGAMKQLAVPVQDFANTGDLSGQTHDFTEILSPEESEPKVDDIFIATLPTMTELSISDAHLNDFDLVPSDRHDLPENTCSGHVNIHNNAAQLSLNDIHNIQSPLIYLHQEYAYAQAVQDIVHSSDISSLNHSEQNVDESCSVLQPELTYSFN